MKKSFRLGGIIVALMLTLSITSCMSCKKTTTDVVTPVDVIVVDSLPETVAVDSLDTDLVIVENNEQLNAEIAKLMKAMDSINQSNENLRNFIKHQDKMIKK